MKAVFSVISLMLAVLIVAFVAGRQLSAMRKPAATDGASMSLSASGPADSQAKQIEAQAVNDIAKAAQQDATRRDDADK